MLRGLTCYSVFYWCALPQYLQLHLKLGSKMLRIFWVIGLLSAIAACGGGGSLGGARF
jgi:hypothetical protein